MLKPGQCVRIGGFISRPELNGLHAHVDSYIAATNRYSCIISTGELVHLSNDEMVS